jgi:hypothetical protein
MFMTGKIVVTGAFVNMTVSFRRYLLMLRQTAVETTAGPVSNENCKRLIEASVSLLLLTVY